MPARPASYGSPHEPKKDALPAKSLPIQEGVVEREKGRSPLPPQRNPYAGIKLLLLLLLGVAILGGGWYYYNHCDFSWVSSSGNGTPNPTDGIKPFNGVYKPTKDKPLASSREKAVEGWLQTEASGLKCGSLEGYLNGAGKKVTLALVDIGATLIIKEKEGAEERVNQGLTIALKEAGIKDVALFTQMGRRRMALEKGDNPKGEMTCWQLIQALEAAGFKVWTVITPADPIYKQGLGFAYKDCVEGNLAKSEKQESDVDTYDSLTTAYFDSSKNIDPRNKRSMFRYFMERCSQFAGSLFFIDDDPGLGDFYLEEKAPFKSPHLLQKKKRKTRLQALYRFRECLQKPLLYGLANRLPCLQAPFSTLPVTHITVQARLLYLHWFAYMFPKIGRRRSMV